MNLRSYKIAAIPGDGIDYPIATFWTSAMMLEHPGGTARSAELTRAVCDFLRQ